MFKDLSPKSLFMGVCFVFPVLLNGEMDNQGGSYESTEWIEKGFEKIGVSPVDFWHTAGDFPDQTSGNAVQGRWESESFELGEKLLLYLGGDFNSDQVGLYLLNTKTEEELVLRPRLRVETIELLKWSIPENWQGKEVRLVAFDNSPKQTAWVGLSDPFTELPKTLFSDRFGIYFKGLISLFLPLLAFCSIGLVSYFGVTKTWKSGVEYLVPIFWISPFLVGYGVFYLYLYSTFLGQVVSVGLVLGSFLLLANFRRAFGHVPKDEIFDLVATMGLCLLSTGFIHSYLHLGLSDLNSVRLAQTRFFAEALPLDNFLPYLTMERLYDGDSLKPFILEWRSTDRPPLQAAACLLFRPFYLDSVETYQIFSTFLQCSVICGISFFLRSIGIVRYRLWILGAVIFSGTFLINGVFVWPKFLPISFLFMLLGVLCRRACFIKDQGTWLLVGFLACCATLIHPGSIFAILSVLGIYTVVNRKLCVSQFVAAAIVFVMMMLPWLIYQKTYDPPGDMLQKRFLADHPYFDDVSLKDALVSAYSNLTFGDWLNSRYTNFKVLVGDFGEAHENFLESIGKGSFQLRFYQFLFFGISMIPLIFFLPLVPFARKHWDSRIRSIYTQILLMIVIGVSFWAVVVLPEGRTLISHGSYFFPILLCVVILAASAKSKWLFFGAWISNFFYFAVVWLIPEIQSVQKDALYDSMILIPETAGFYCFFLAASILWLCFSPIDQLAKRADVR